MNHFNRSRRENIEVESVSVNSSFQILIKQINIVFEPNPLPNFIKMLFAHPAAKLGIMQQQVGEFGALLHQIQFRHAFGLAFELRRRNPDQFAQHIARIVKGQRLIKVTGEQITLHKLFAHRVIRFILAAKHQ